MQFDPEELDRIAERLREDLSYAFVPDDGTIKGLDPHRLYTAGQVAERWNVSKDTVYRNLRRADWNGQGGEDDSGEQPYEGTLPGRSNKLFCEVRAKIKAHPRAWPCGWGATFVFQP